MVTYVKLCGFTRLQDLEAAVAAGADAVGLNLIPSSKRYVSSDLATQLAQHGSGKVEVVAVVADLSEDALRELQRSGLYDRAQLSGSEPPELVAALQPWAFKGVRIADAADVADAQRYGGERLLVDAKVAGALGGTGHRFDWKLVGELARERDLIVAGGLTPTNVGDAVRELKPWGVDVASGVEAGTPGVKDPEGMKAFVRAVREAEAKA